MNLPQPSPARRLSMAVLLALAFSQESSGAQSNNDLGDLLYQENFNQSTNFNSWFIFGAGDSFTYRGDIIPLAGKDGSNALIFSANAENYRNYWLGGIGRGSIIREPWTSLDKLTLQLELGSLGDEKVRRVTLRLVQGDTNKPTWSVKWVLEVSRTIKTYELVLNTGEQTGEYQRDQPITLHAIMFGHSHFGSAPDIQILVDNVKAFGRDRVPPAH